MPLSAHILKHGNCIWPLSAKGASIIKNWLMERKNGELKEKNYHYLIGHIVLIFLICEVISFQEEQFQLSMINSAEKLTVIHYFTIVRSVTLS